MQKSIQLRIGIAGPADPSNPRTWSGIPYGISQGLRAFGVEVVPLKVAPESHVGNAACRWIARTCHDPAIRAERGLARETVAYSKLYSHTAARRLRHAGPLDAVIQMGAGYHVPHPVVLTYEDMTVTQAVEYGFGPWQRFTTGTIAARIAQQLATYQRVQAVSVMTTWAARAVEEDYGIDPAKIHVVGGGSNVEPCPTCGPADDPKWQTPTYLFVGGDWERKNGPALVRAFARVREHFPQAKLHLVGKHDLITEPGVIDHGILPLGDPASQEKLHMLRQAATCLVLPSEIEPGGLIYVDAGSYGVPSIGTTSGGAIDMVGPGGVLVNPGDEDALVAAMLEMADGDHARKLGALARQNAAQFTWTKVAERMLAALQPQIERQRARLAVE